MTINKLMARLFVLSVLFLSSCSDDDSTSEPKGDYENGILISGEGSSTGTGSISFVSNDFVTTENLIYKKVNNAELGTFLQSMAFDGDDAYIIVDNANTLTIVDRYTFEEKGTITTDLSTPRYMTVVGDKGYVTNWGSTADETDDFIAIVDLSSSTVESTISVGNGPERIIANNGKLYVSHKGAFTNNDIISVIDIATENIQEVTVKDKPDELFFNSSGDLVVLSEGRILYDASFNVIGNTLGSISTINPSTLNVSSELDFVDGEHPSFMVFDGNTIYYGLNNEIYKLDDNATTLPTTSILTVEIADPSYSFYGMEVESDKIFILETSFKDTSKLNIYDLITKELIDTKTIALGASKIYFN